MKRIFELSATIVLLLTVNGAALAQESQPSQATQPAEPAPDGAPADQAPPEEPAPPAEDWTRVYPEGRWVYTSTYGWIWVPNGAATSAVEGVPYVYLYTPAYGWTWYVSPWGVGPYVYGAWVLHPWHPVGFRGVWVAGPRVVVRLRRPIVAPVHGAPTRVVARPRGDHRR